jgi:hypothetical protein
MWASDHVNRLKRGLAIRSTRISLVGASCALLVAFGSYTSVAQNSVAQNSNELASPTSFSGIQNTQMRSRALFTEAAKVIMNPRCLNCHPAGDHPLQGNDQHIHTPPVSRGAFGDGVPGIQCSACHQDHNVTLVDKDSYQSIPGRPGWMLAPRTMSWEGKSTTEVCEQLKDPARNSDRTLTQLYEHFLTSDFVGWGWNPGLGRDPVPGTQQQLAELIRAWIDTGAECP